MAEEGRDEERGAHMSSVEGAPARVVSQIGDTATVALHGEIDIANSSQIRAYLTGCLDDGCANIILDLRDLTFMDAAGLSVLVYVTRMTESRHGHLTLQRSPPMVHKLLDISGLADLIHVTEPDFG